MGNPRSPVVDNFFMEHFEEEAIASAPVKPMIQLNKTGGGYFKKPTVDETGQKLIAALQAQFFPLANPYDDDASFHPEVMSEFHGSNEFISVTTSDESQAIAAQEMEHIILLEDIPAHTEVVESTCIEEVSDPKSIGLQDDLHTALASTSKTATEVTKSRSPKRKETGDSVLDMKKVFYERRLECLESEHRMKMECIQAEYRVKMETLNLDKELKQLQILEIKIKLGLNKED
ncbi:uncharacterized protein [Anabrus simplex]|uniref:uncharacterized protein n=1 Tax=Anabrus simplex TaxID=316456 RepID=UPI0035A29DB5